MYLKRKRVLEGNTIYPRDALSMWAIKSFLEHVTVVSAIIDIENGSWGDLEQAMPAVITVNKGANPGLKLTMKMVQQCRVNTCYGSLESGLWFKCLWCHLGLVTQFHHLSTSGSRSRKTPSSMPDWPTEQIQGYSWYWWAHIQN